MAPSVKNDSQLVNGEAKNLKQEEGEGDTFISALNLTTSLVLSMTLNSAIELGVFDVIAKEGEGTKLSAKEIAAKLCSKNPEAPTMLDRILRLLASNSVLNCSVADDDQVERLYSLTPMASQYFVTDAQGVSFGSLMPLIHDKVFLESWSELKGAIMEGGIPFNRVHGMHAFEYPSLDPRFNEIFNKAMFNSTTIIMKKVLETYKGFENVNRLVDVGGGVGVNLKLITSKYPHIQGINFDLPHVIQHAPSHPGVEHVAGDMFESVPQGDAIFVKWILHDWSDEHCLKLLKNLYNAIPDDGKVIVVDTHLPIVPETSTAAKTLFQGDVLMMTQTPGGKERTKQEFLELATAAGFSEIKFVCHVCGMWVMEFFKSQLKGAILEGGIPFNRAHDGMHAFEYPSLDPRFNQVFNKAMVNSTSFVIKKILESYNGFEDITTLVDVGGGLGITINFITSKYPQIQGINFDLPHVIQNAASYLGVEHVGGDMFESVPKGDAIFMKSMLHDWSNEQCLKLLKNCYNAIPEDGKVIVVEAVLPVVPNTSTSVRTICRGDVLMMTQNPGGKERTEPELMELAIRSGFSGIRFECFVCDLWVMELFK